MQDSAGQTDLGNRVQQSTVLRTQSPAVSADAVRSITPVRGLILRRQDLLIDQTCTTLIHCKANVRRQPFRPGAKIGCRRAQRRTSSVRRFGCKTMRGGIRSGAADKIATILRAPIPLIDKLSASPEFKASRPSPSRTSAFRPASADREFCNGSCLFSMAMPRLIRPLRQQGDQQVPMIRADIGVYIAADLSCDSLQAVIEFWHCDGRKANQPVRGAATTFRYVSNNRSSILWRK